MVTDSRHFTGMEPPFAAIDRRLTTAPLASATSFTGFAPIVVATETPTWQNVARHLRWQLYFDPVTELLNRTAFEESTTAAIHQFQESIAHGNAALAVVCLQIERFEQMVDLLGHVDADRLRACFARLLEETFPAEAVLARISENNFAVLLATTEEQTVHPIAQRIASVLALLQSRLHSPLFLAGQEVYLSVQMGASLCPRDGNDTDSLMHAAAVAMHQTLPGSGESVTLYEPAMHERLRRRMRLATDLKRAVERDELRLHFQPILSVGKRCIVGVEALLRWQHPEEGLLAPNQFIGIAEDSGIIGELGQWALSHACRQVAQWRREGHDIQVAVNLSARQFLHGDIAERVAHALASSGLEASALHLEITESTLMDGGSDSLDMLHRLRHQGVELALDDFGTGYSALSYLHVFPIDIIKVDKTFIERLPEPRTDAIVRSLIGLAHALGMRVIAEGVETDTQAQMLRDMGCDALQGFHFGHPMTADAITEWLTNDNGYRTSSKV